jgi:hypothetical protein
LISPSADGPLEPHEEIAALEVRIEELAEALDRCRKFALAAKIANIFSALLTVATLVGVLTITQMAMLGGVRRPARRDRRLRPERFDVGCIVEVAARCRSAAR